MFNKYLKFLIPVMILQNFISCSQINYNQVDYNFFLNFESNKVLIDVRSYEEISIRSVDDFIQMTTGQAGTQAEFRIYGDENSFPRTFTRAPLDL